MKQTLPRTDKLTQRASVLCLIKAQEKIHNLENKLEKVENSKNNYRSLYFEILSDLEDKFYCDFCKNTFHCEGYGPYIICLNCISDLYPDFVDETDKTMYVYKERYVSIDNINFVDKKGKKLVFLPDEEKNIIEFTVNLMNYE